MRGDSDGRMFVLYDGDCGVCKVLMAGLLSWDRARRLTPVAIQSALGGRLLADLSTPDRMSSWHLVDERGRRRSAGTALPELLRAVPYGVPLARLAERFPGATSAGYEWVATNRVKLGRPIGERPRAWAQRVIDERSLPPER